MDVTDLRIALFSGNYNMTLDGANKALNRLAAEGYLELHRRRGAMVRRLSATASPPGEKLSLLT